MKWCLKVSLGPALWAAVLWQEPGAAPLGIWLAESGEDLIPRERLQNPCRRLEHHPLGDMLRAYGAGEPVDPALWPLVMGRGTSFQRRVWQEARRIPRGTVLTYGALALRLGMPGGARAVGGALHRNPWPLLVPCHRVVASDGPGGFAPGLALKRRLWDLEGWEEG